jgi:hypothetical protein
VNAVTGQISQQTDEQDYYVVPDPGAVNGYKSNINARTKQFCCPDLAQADAARQKSTTIRFEITPHTNSGSMSFFSIDFRPVAMITMARAPDMTVKELKDRVGLLYETPLSVSTKVTYDGKEIEGRVEF